VVVAGAPTFSRAPSVEGRWDAVVTVKNLQVPFRLDIRPAADGVQGVFYDGDRAANPSTRGSFEDGLLHLAFDSHAAALDARYEDGVLRGTYGDYPFEARPHRAAKTAAGPDIAGIWEIPTESPKGE